MAQELAPVETAAERDSNRIIEQQLDERIAAVEAAAGADVVTYVGPIYGYASDAIKDAVEQIAPRRRKLLVVLETGGGYIDVAERIATIFRHHYRRVDFLVPTYAMSAGTVLVMSGDSILMDYASVLGPIDPQVARGNDLVPALGYLVQYERLIEKSERGVLTTAELAYLVRNFDAAELYRYEQERELSIALLQEWLVKYKFKNWKKTETRGMSVTKAMRQERALAVATKLNETDHWHSHSRGIPIEVLRRDLKLLIDDFGEDAKLRGPLHDYYRLLKDYTMRRMHELIVLHTKGHYVGI
jgi:ClpP class serine protease